MTKTKPRTIRITAALTAAALILTGLAHQPTANADGCTYNAQIAGQCTELIIVDRIPAGLADRAYQATYTDPDSGAKFEAVCAVLSGAQILCAIGAPIAIPIPAFTG